LFFLDLAVLLAAASLLILFYFNFDKFVVTLLWGKKIRIKFKFLYCAVQRSTLNSTYRCNRTTLLSSENAACQQDNTFARLRDGRIAHVREAKWLLYHVISNRNPIFQNTSINTTNLDNHSPSACSPIHPSNNIRARRHWPYFLGGGLEPQPGLTMHAKQGYETRHETRDVPSPYPCPSLAPKRNYTL
jgi:hypothetical protein